MDDRSGSPAGPERGPEPDQLREASLRRAIELYLAIAYPGGELPAPVRRRLEWPAADDLATLLASPPFEKAGKARGTNSPIYALRLGNYQYPHMKMQVQSWPIPQGFILSVNTHDQVMALEPDSADAEGFRRVQAENQRLKEQIELAWDRAGLPTFVRYLRDYIASQMPPTS